MHRGGSEGEREKGKGEKVDSDQIFIVILHILLHTHTPMLSTVSAAPPTLLKATPLSSSADTQTFNFTWEVAPEAASTDHLRGFVLHCHDSTLSLDSSPVGEASVSGVTFVQSAIPLYAIAIAVATSCRELACQVSAFNEVGEGVASSVVTLPPSCSEGVVFICGLIWS